MKKKYFCITQCRAFKLQIISSKHERKWVWLIDFNTADLRNEFKENSSQYMKIYFCNIIFNGNLALELSVPS